MNGDTAELCPNMINIPTSMSMMIIGSSHHFLRTRMKAHRSPKIDSFDMVLNEGVDERRQHGILRENEEQTKEDDDDQNRHQPPFLAHTHELPEIPEDREFRHRGGV